MGIEKDEIKRLGQGLVEYLALKGVYYGSRESRSGQILTFSNFWTKLVKINNSTSMSNYCDEAHSDNGIYIKKAVSAWTEVWSNTWPSRASIMAPGVRDLGEF